MGLLKALRLGTWGSSALIVVAAAVLAAVGVITWGVFGAVIAGLIAGVIIGYSTEYYTSDEYKPTQGVARQAKMGPATVIIDGLAVGMMSALVPVDRGVRDHLCLRLGWWLPRYDGWSLRIAFAAVGMLATLGITLATDAH